MAISHICGFEMGSPSESQNAGTGFQVQTSIVRSGTYAGRSAAGNLNALTFFSRAAGGSNRSVYRSVRFYLRVTALGTAADNVVCLTNGTTTASGWELRINTNGTLFLRAVTGGVVLGTSTNALSADGFWHRIEVDCGWNGGVGVRLFVDGIQWISDSSTSISAQAGGMIGKANSGSSAGNFYFDDVVWYDSALPATLEDYKVGLLDLKSDVNIGGWLGPDDLKNTLLIGEIADVPPKGNTSTTALVGYRIENTVSSTTDNFDALCNSYAYLPNASRTGPLYGTPAVYGILLGNATSSTKLAQQFRSEIDGSVDVVSMVLAKVGAPTDNLSVSIYTNNAGVPGTQVGTGGTILGSTLSTSAYAYFDFTVSATLTADTTYFIVIERSGAIDGTNYYKVHPSSTGTARPTAVHNGTSWSVAGSDMLVAVRSSAAITVQAVQAIVNDAQAVTTGSPKAGAVSIASISGPSQHLWQSTYTLGAGVAQQEVAQSFIANESVITSVSVNLGKVGTMADGVIMKIYASSGGLPTGSALGQATVLASGNITTTMTWFNLPLITPVSVTPGSEYAIVLSRGAPVNSSNYFLVARSTGDEYALGQPSRYNATGTPVWESGGLTGDMVFVVTGASQTELSFDYGLPHGTAGSTSATAMGTFPTAWGTHIGPVTENPTVSLTSGPIVRVGKRTATTREVDVDFLGAYVMWKPPAATGGITRPKARASGTFNTKPAKIRASGTFTEKQMKIRVGGSWVTV